jgi:hypothetical protein
VIPGAWLAFSSVAFAVLAVCVSAIMARMLFDSPVDPVDRAWRQLFLASRITCYARDGFAFLFWIHFLWYLWT